MTADLLAAARGEPVRRTPVWFMRQAGRSLPEYRRIREGVPMLASCRDPDLVTEITLQPVRRYGVDAAIFYSDIVVPLAAAGIDLDIVPGTGPVVAVPVRSSADVRRLPTLAADQLPFISAAVQAIVSRLRDEHEGIPLIGFAGAPFTLASYLVEGGPSKDHARTKAFMHTEPAVFAELLSALADISATFLRAQIDAGAQAVQLFDSWVGTLSAADYRRHVAPHSAAVLRRVADVPRIHFGVGTGELLADLAAAGADVVGVDWRTPLDVAAGRVGPAVALQGNLDPALLGAPPAVLERAVAEVLAAGAAASGHIFNLGHGVPPDADPAALARVVELVHAGGGRGPAPGAAAAGDERPAPRPQPSAALPAAPAR